MKRFFILFTIALAASGAARAQTLHVALNKLYNDSMDFVLPDKAIKQKMPVLTVANPKYDFTVKFRDIALRIASEDYENNVFTVMLQYSGVGISIIIDSQDILDMTDAKFNGDFIVERRHFVLLENEDNKDLLKTYFKRIRGKDVVMERTFEKALDLIQAEPSHYNGIYNERQRTLKNNELIINGHDKLHAPVVKTQEPKQEPEIDDSDAFKLDVELFDE